ncbi:acetyl-CoA carboxylase biotin carboxyl carrier protein subunit [Occallatibacter riparius]|uniref:Acetyl-CoA carboxylase biotin carboxyl carrier protein subunit n=1 Tax=Occallatibacter riparius TaxID=1002689 RepID=A0A9J7BXP0_9BACT|nr:acetyl-CoA carboxylase biotin carboxyl carrier protein subunit [Occallatibacter riparius]UWZ85806.1 acetyl-CoA carboxylase biotin carboxyl carrier protein subunit [Occallatibacter riparius]
MKLRITIAGNVYEAEVEVLDEEEVAAPYVAPPAPVYVPAVSVPPTSGNAFDNDLSNGIRRSPVTGLVIRVPVAPGQSVEAGELLLVLEAMKMETQVTAPRAGTVQKVHVEPGNSVKVGQVLVELEARDGEKG